MDDWLIGLKSHNNFKVNLPSRSRDTDKISIVLSIYVAESPTIHVGVIGWLVSSGTPILKSIDPAVPEILKAVTHPSTNRARCCLTSAKSEMIVSGSNPADYAPPRPIWHEFVRRYIGRWTTTDDLAMLNFPANVARFPTLNDIARFLTTPYWTADVWTAH